MTMFYFYFTIVVIAICNECRFYLSKRLFIYISGDPHSSGSNLGMLYNNNKQFSSPDMATACTLKRKAGWWHLNCSNANLNGLYKPGVSAQDSMFWYGFKDRIGLKKASMKLKRK